MRAHRQTPAGPPLFITQVTWRRERIFADVHNAALLRETWRSCRDSHPFRMIAWVILPDHFHLLIEPSDGWSVAQVLRCIKGRFTVVYRRGHGLQPGTIVWQKGYYDHVIRDQEDLNRHVDYIHANPVKHALARSPEEWSESSFATFKARGSYPDGWGWAEEPFWSLAAGDE